MLSLVVWLGARLFEVRNYWTDIVAQVTLPFDGTQEPFVVPGFGMLMFVVVGIGVLYLMHQINRSVYMGAVAELHNKNGAPRLPIQMCGTALHTDSMNENFEPLVAWFPQRLARWVIVFYVLKLIIALVIFVLAIVIPIVATFIGFGDVGNVVAGIFKEVAFLLFRYAMNVDGMVVLGYAILVTFAFSLYKHERIFIRDYAVMTQQLTKQ